MIRFACRCGQIFEEPDDSAGLSVQCPRCRLLLDIPRLGELESLADDGAYRVDERPSRAAPPALDTMFHIYRRSTVDDEGESIDLRMQPHELANVGVHELGSPETRPSPPRYDPETGELIDSIPVHGEQHDAPKLVPAALPFAKRAVTYASAGASVASSGSAIFQLSRPVNLLVMGFVMLLHLIAWGFSYTIAGRLLIFAPFSIAAVIAIISHYGNVVDEVATEESDDLPRVVRDLRGREDIWGPFIGVMLPLALCFAPALAVFILGYHSMRLELMGALVLGLSVVGAFFLPGLSLTLLTSGSIVNMRPDRVLRLIHRCGSAYLVPVMAFMVSAAPYLWAITGLLLGVLQFTGYIVVGAIIPKWAYDPALMWPLMCVAIFGMHYVCFVTGLLYRKHHMEFPWVNRFHAREPRPPVVRRKPSYVRPSARP